MVSKSPRKVTEKSLNASTDKTLKDNYIGTNLQKKNFISPRALATASTSQDKTNIYNSLSNRKGLVSASLGFQAGALKEKVNNSSVVDRLSSNSGIALFFSRFKFLIGGMKVHKGPFHLNSVTTKNPKYLMNELTKILENNKIYFRNVSFYFWTICI